MATPQVVISRPPHVKATFRTARLIRPTRPPGGLRPDDPFRTGAHCVRLRDRSESSARHQQRKHGSSENEQDDDFALGCEWTILFSWPVLPGTDAAEIFNVRNLSALLHR
jgi:hypothetical protein